MAAKDVQKDGAIFHSFIHSFITLGNVCHRLVLVISAPHSIILRHIPPYKEGSRTQAERVEIDIFLQPLS